MSTEWIDDLTAKSPAAMYVAWAGEVVFSGAREDDRIGRSVQFKIVRPPEQAGNANPFARYTRRRKGHAGTRFEASFSGVEHVKEFMLEVMLLNWGDSPKGSTVTFVLPAEGDRHPFMGDSRDATTYALVLVEKDDDEAVVDQVKRDRVENPKRGLRAKQRLSNAAVQICKNPVFLQWVREEYDDTVKDLTDLTDWLYIGLNIESRAQLDTDEFAAKEFKVMCDSFVAWQKAKGLLK